MNLLHTPAKGWGPGPACNQLSNPARSPVTAPATAGSRKSETKLRVIKVAMSGPAPRLCHGQSLPSCALIHPLHLLLLVSQGNASGFHECSVDLRRVCGPAPPSSLSPSPRPPPWPGPPLWIVPLPVLSSDMYLSPQRTPELAAARSEGAGTRLPQEVRARGPVLLRQVSTGALGCLHARSKGMAICLGSSRNPWSGQPGGCGQVSWDFGTGRWRVR